MMKRLFIWIFVVLLITPLAAHAEVSCREYQENINNPYVLFPKGLSAEEYCHLIPDECGPGFLLFNPEGKKAFYYKSQCFMSLVRKTLDEKHCDNVKERPSLLDGSYYSRKSCLENIRQTKSDAAAKKVNPEGIHRIKSIHARVAEGALNVDAFLSYGTAAGKYALAFSANYEENGVMVHQALNPKSPDIIYDETLYKRV